MRSEISFRLDTQDARIKQLGITIQHIAYNRNQPMVLYLVRFRTKVVALHGF